MPWSQFRRSSARNQGSSPAGGNDPSGGVQDRRSRPDTPRSTSRSGHPSRYQAVGAQYEGPAAAAAYASGYKGWGPIARYNHSRFHVLDQALQGSRGALLDIGCGPGMLVRHLLETRPDIRITACDRSPAMVDAVATRLGEGSAKVELGVASIEDLPFADGAFDVVVALGVLEYVDCSRALREMSRVVRPGGTVVVTMLNPTSPYRLFEWCVYWPARRALGRVERLVGIPPERRHGATVPSTPEYALFAADTSAG